MKGFEYIIYLINARQLPITDIYANGPCLLIALLSA